MPKTFSNLKVYIFTLCIGFVLAVGVWILILFNIDPYKADFMSIASFYASAFLWLFCLFSIIGYYIRLWRCNKEVVYANLPIAMRQGAIISIAITGLLILQTLRVLNWWIAGIWIVVVMVVELFFRARTL
jgi:hypothetical protein